MSEPLATYRDAAWNYRRSTDFFRDRVVVRVRTSRMNSEGIVPLSELRPTPNLLQLRPMGPLFAGLVLLLIAVVAEIFAIGSFPFSITAWPYPVRLVSAGLGILLSLRGLRLIAYSQFVSHGGIVMIAVGRTGPDARRYDEFVALLKDTIAACQVKRDGAP